MDGYITRVADEIADILVREGIDYVQSKSGVQGGPRQGRAPCAKGTPRRARASDARGAAPVH